MRVGGDPVGPQPGLGIQRDGRQSRADPELHEVEEGAVGGRRPTRDRGNAEDGDP